MRADIKEKGITPGQMITKLYNPDVLGSKGQTVGQIIWKLRASEVTYYGLEKITLASS
ncbi:MAG: hypothetical protein ACLPX5_04825 [Dissulfurispiraceae bacterium]